MEHHFFAYISRMRFIQRWGLMRNTLPENDMEHALQTAMVAHCIAVMGNVRYQRNYNAEYVMALAVYHDSSEVITGDLPTPIKYFNREMKTAYKALERKASERLLDMLPDSLREDYAEYVLPDEGSPEYRVVKAADRLAAYLKCVEEMRAGNNEFKKAMLSIEEDLRKLGRPEVDYFLREFAPAFDLTLDELD